MVGAAHLERGQSTAEARELIWRKFGDSLGDFFDFHLRSIPVSNASEINFCVTDFGWIGRGDWERAGDAAAPLSAGWRM